MDPQNGGDVVDLLHINQRQQMFKITAICHFIFITAQCFPHFLISVVFVKYYMEMLNLSPPHLRQMNVSHVSGTEGPSCVETRPHCQVCECIKDSHHQTAGYFGTVNTMQCVQDTDTCEVCHYTGMRHCCRCYSPNLNMFLKAMPHFITNFFVVFISLHLRVSAVSLKIYFCIVSVPHVN